METETATEPELRNPPRSRWNTSPLSRIRSSLGISQTEIAERMGVSQRGVSDRENGIVAFSPGEAVAYVEALGVTAKSLKARVRALGGKFPPARNDGLAARRGAAARGRQSRRSQETVAMLSDRALAWVADHPGPHFAHEWAPAIYPGVTFKSRQAAGNAVSSVLVALERRGLVARLPKKDRSSPQAWEIIGKAEK